MLSSAAQPVASIAPEPRILKNLRRQQIPSLHGVRAIAAYTVVLHHSVLPGNFGTLAVHVFFVLSGFLITTLLIREHEKRGTVSLKSFYLRRTLRILPPFYGAWLVTVALAIVANVRFSWGEAWAVFAYCGDYYHALVHETATPPLFLFTWSLGIEEKFYLIWPAVFVFCAGNWSRLFKVSAGTVVSIWLYRAGLVLIGHQITYSRFAFDARVDLILLGCALSALLANPRGAEWVDRLTSGFWPLPVLTGVLLLTGGAVPYPVYLTVLVPFQGILIAYLLCHVVAWGESPRLRWLNGRVASVGGDLSYAIYLYFVPAAIATRHILAPLRWRWQLLSILLTPVVFAFLSHHLIERPFLRLKQRWN